MNTTWQRIRSAIQDHVFLGFVSKHTLKGCDSNVFFIIGTTLHGRSETLAFQLEVSSIMSIRVIVTKYHRIVTIW